MQTLPLERRIEAFARLGRVMLRAAGEETPLPPEEEGLAQKLTTNIPQAQKSNSWFDEENVRRALQALGSVMTEEKLEQWVARYPQLQEERSPRDVLVIMAGNIPLVGFHDMLSVLITGNCFLGRTSRRDAGLHREIADILISLEPAFAPFIRFNRERPEQVDAVIATGSDNTARYFEYYYKNIPAIIRHNRNSLAVLDGQETKKDLEGLANDIFWYYGLGCRSVSMLFVPEGYDLKQLFSYFRQHNHVTNLPAYRHNLDYQRAVFRMSDTFFLDAGNLLITKDTALASPIAVLHYQTYKALKDILTYVGAYVDKIQCLATREGLLPDTVPLGKTQFPEVWEYEDGVDTVAFLSEL